MKCVKCVIICLLIVGNAVSQNRLPNLLASLNKVPQDTNRVLLYKQIANFYRINKPDSAIFFVNQGLNLSQRLKYNYGIASMNGMLGMLEISEGKMASAKSRLTIALNIFEKTHNQHGIASAQNGLGILAGRKALYKEATQHFLKALKIYQIANDTNGIIEAHIKLGIVNEQTNNLDKALDHYNKGMQLDKQIPVSKTTVTLLNDIGIVYAKKNDMKVAQRYFLDGLKKATNPQWTDVRTLLLLNAGGVYERLGNIKIAFSYENEALQLIRQRHLPDQEVNTLVNLASLLSKTKPDSSTLLLNQALVIARRIHQPYLRLDIYQGMVDLNKQQGNYKDAEQILETRNKLQDSLFTLKNSKEIAELQSNYELANQTVKVQQLQLINTRIQFHQNIILAITAGVLLVLIVIIYFYNKTRRLNRVLIRQKEELHKLNIFKDKLFSIIGHDLRSPMSSIVSMLQVFEEDILSVQDVQLFVPQLKEQSKVTLDILDKLLMWGKSQLKGVHFNKSVFNAKELIQKNILLYKSVALQKGIELTDHTPEILSIYADMDHADFIIRNLLANAIKYTRKGGKVEIAAAMNQPAGFNTIIIKDNGIGIAKDLQLQIFEPDNESMEGTANEKGNSIGLMLCKEFTEENNGQLEVKSELGQGTELYISFPINKIGV